MEQIHPLRQIRNVLGIGQNRLAKMLNTSQQNVSKQEVKPTIDSNLAEKLLNAVELEFPDDVERVGEILSQSRGIFMVGTVDLSAPRDWGHAHFEPIEPSAWTWAMSFRTNVILDKAQVNAESNGFRTERFGQALAILSKPRRPKPSQEEPLFSTPQKYGLGRGTLLAIGASSRHRHSASLVRLFEEKFQIGLKIREYSKNPRYDYYFGYPTILKQLIVNDECLSPSRSVQHDHLCYEDYGVILCSPVARLDEGRSPFRRDVKRIVAVGGLHRLGTGIGVRVAEDREFRERSFSIANSNCDLESNDRMRVIVFRVILRFDGCASRLSPFQILYDKTLK